MIIEKIKIIAFTIFLNIKQVFAFKVVKVIDIIIVTEI